MQLMFAKGHHKITPRENCGRGPGLGELPKMFGPPLIFLQWLKLANSNMVFSLGSPRPIIKLHPEKKWVWPWARGANQNISLTAKASEFKFGVQLGFTKTHHKNPTQKKKRAWP